MKLNRQQLLNNVQRVNYNTAVIYTGVLTAEQAADRTAYLTLSSKVGEENDLAKQLDEFCSDHLGYSWSIVLKRSNSSHGHGVNFCVVELPPAGNDSTTPVKSTFGFQTPFTDSQSQLELFKFMADKMGGELEMKYQMKYLQDKLEDALKQKPEGNGDPHWMQQIAIIGHQIMKQFQKPTIQTEAEFLGLLNVASGGALNAEVEALNGLPAGDGLTEEEIKILTEFIGVSSLKKLAYRIKTGDLSPMEITMLKGI